MSCPQILLQRVCESDPCLLPLAHKGRELFKGTNCLLLRNCKASAPVGSATQAFA